MIEIAAPPENMGKTCFETGFAKLSWVSPKSESMLHGIQSFPCKHWIEVVTQQQALQPLPITTLCLVTAQSNSSVEMFMPSKAVWWWVLVNGCNSERISVTTCCGWYVPKAEGEIAFARVNAHTVFSGNCGRGWGCLCVWFFSPQTP